MCSAEARYQTCPRIEESPRDFFVVLRSVEIRRECRILCRPDDGVLRQRKGVIQRAAGEGLLCPLGVNRERGEARRAVQGAEIDREVGVSG